MHVLGSPVLAKPSFVRRVHVRVMLCACNAMKAGQCQLQSMLCGIACSPVHLCVCIISSCVILSCSQISQILWQYDAAVRMRSASRASIELTAERVGAVPSCALHCLRLLWVGDCLRGHLGLQLHSPMAAAGQL